MSVGKGDWFNISAVLISMVQNGVAVVVFFDCFFITTLDLDRELSPLWTWWNILIDFNVFKHFYADERRVYPTDNMDKFTCFGDTKPVRDFSEQNVCIWYILAICVYLKLRIFKVYDKMERKKTFELNTFIPEGCYYALQKTKLKKFVVFSYTRVEAFLNNIRVKPNQTHKSGFISCIP